LNKQFQQWITLFDDVEDDEFDGELGDDDEELPMINCSFVILTDEPVQKQVMGSPPRLGSDKSKATTSGVSLANQKSPRGSPRHVGFKGSVVENKSNSPNNRARRKTITDAAGIKKIVEVNGLYDTQEPKAVNTGKFSKRKYKKN